MLQDFVDKSPKPEGFMNAFTTTHNKSVNPLSSNGITRRSSRD